MNQYQSVNLPTIKEKMIKYGISQTEIANDIGMSPSHVCSTLNFTRGNISINDAKIRPILERLNRRQPKCISEIFQGVCDNPVLSVRSNKLVIDNLEPDTASIIYSEIQDVFNRYSAEILQLPTETRLNLLSLLDLCKP